MLSDLTPQNRRDFQSLTCALEAHFEPKNQAEMYRAQLKNRLRSREESLTELGQNIKKLTRKAYPTATFELWEKLACDAFIDALNDADLEWAIYQGKPKGIEEAVKLGIECEAFRDGRRRRTSHRSGVRTQRMECDVTSQRDWVDQAATVVSDIAGPQSTYVPNNGHFQRNKDQQHCFYCKQLGHWKRQCKKWIHDQQMRSRNLSNTNLPGTSSDVSGN